MALGSLLLAVKFDYMLAENLPQPVKQHSAAERAFLQAGAGNIIVLPGPEVRQVYAYGLKSRGAFLNT